MIKVLNELISEVYKFNNIKSKKHQTYLKDDIKVSVNREVEKLTVWAVNEKTNRKIDLTAKKYKTVFNIFDDLGEVIYNYESKTIIVKLKNSSINKITIYGYCRVSSKSQLENNSLEQQVIEIKNKYCNADIYEEQFTGTTTVRPVLTEVVSKVSKGDMLVVSKLDRLARNVKEGIEIIEMLFNKGVSVHVLNIGLLEDTTMGKFFLTTMLAVSEMERNMILERTQAGRAVARTKSGYIEGRPKKFTKLNIEHALSLLSVNGGTMSYKEVSLATDISKSTLIRANRVKQGTELM